MGTANLHNLVMFQVLRRLVNVFCALHTTHRCAAISPCPVTPFSSFPGRIGALRRRQTGQTVNAQARQEFPALQQLTRHFLGNRAQEVGASFSLMRRSTSAARASSSPATSTG